jgi:hypothetical protein
MNNGGSSKSRLFYLSQTIGVAIVRDKSTLCEAKTSVLPQVAATTQAKTSVLA